MKQNSHKTQFIYSFYVQLIIINLEGFFHLVKFSITFQTRRINILYDKLNTLLHMRDHLFHITSITKYLGKIYRGLHRVVPPPRVQILWFFAQPILKVLYLPIKTKSTVLKSDTKTIDYYIIYLESMMLSLFI